MNKGGQGPKTSILCFVKGKRTRDVWFYKVTNDGYTMGTNRKPIPGCQLVEALDLFHRHVREGKQPPETRHSFCIPADWIKVLDPRVKDKIRHETRAEMSKRAAEDKTKLSEKLDAQVAAKKLTATERKDRLTQHDELWQSKIENAIAQKIERAHLYSFNLPNYRSSLTPAQLAAWKDFAATYLREDDPSKTLEKQYRAIASAGSDELDELISGLDPRHTLELDVARQFLTGISSKLFTKHPHLQTLQEIIASQQKTPRVQLKDLLEPVSRPVALEEGRTYRRVTVKLYGKGVLLRDRVTLDDLKGDKWFQVKAGDLIFSKIDARNGAFGLIPEALDDGIVSNEFPTFAVKGMEYHPALLAALLGSERFYGQIEAKVSGATGRRRFEPEDLLEFEIPSPNRDAHEELMASINQNRSIVTAADELVTNWLIDTAELNWSNQIPLSDCLDFVSSGSTPLGGDTNYVETGVLFIRSQNILKGECDFSDAVFIPPEMHASMGRTAVCLNDVFLNITGASIGRSAVMEVEREANVNQHVAILRPNSKLLDPHYLCFVLNTSRLQQAINTAQMGASRQGLNFSQIRELRVPTCSLEAQREIGSRLREMNSIRHAVRNLALKSRDNVARILEQLWES